jgi:cobalt-zinc-cadmium resistance protein CzcA
VIRGEGLVQSEDDIRQIVVSTDPDGSPVLLGRVADVRVGPALRFGAVTQLGRGPVVTGTVMMLAGSNSRQVVTAVKDAVAAVQADLPEGMRIEAYYDRAEFIDRVLGTIFRNLAEGAGLVVLVL